MQICFCWRRRISGVDEVWLWEEGVLKMMSALQPEPLAKDPLVEESRDQSRSPITLHA